jgi:glutamyl-tRNA reductase
MNILLVGMNHKTAPLEIREKFSLSCGNNANPLKELIQCPHLKEAMCLSTCNRVEVIANTKDTAAALDSIKDFVSYRGCLSKKEMEKYSYMYFGQDAVRHLFRVASSLDSLVMGEPQILGQVKEAYHLAAENKATGLILNKVLHHAFRTAKRVRTETCIANNAVSVSYAAVELAKKIFGSVKGKTVLLVGAGEMSELAARHLINQEAERFLIANRTFSRASQIAEAFHGKAIEFEQLAEGMADADIVIASTGATGYVITKEMVAKALHRRKNRLLFLIDIAVPRDIEPGAGGIDNAFLYNIDDLQEVVDENIKDRRQEAQKAETIIEEEISKHQAWVNSLAVVPTIVSLREKVEGIVKKEIEKSGSWIKNLGDEERNKVEILAASIVNKIIHDPIAGLKEESQENATEAYLAAARRLFKLDE